MLLQIAAWLYGSALAKLLGGVLVMKLGVNLFPGIEETLMLEQLGVEKSLDMIVFLLTFLFAGVVFGLNYWFKRRYVNKATSLDWLFLGFSFLFFWQAWFVHTARVITILVALGAEFFYLSFVSRKSLGWGLSLKNFPWQNAVLGGYWLVTVTSLFTTSLLLRLSMFLIAIMLYGLCFNWERLRSTLRSPAQLLFLLTLFLPANSNLIWFGLGVWGLSLVSGMITERQLASSLHDAAVIVLVTFNLRFYVGNYDFIEEGVWLGALQGFSLGKVLYRDIWFYHPPLILKLVYLVMQVFGESVFSLRLAFQILRVFGLIFYFYLIKEVLEGKLSRIILFLIALGITTTLVRNNVEIRLGVGFLAILFWYKATKLRNHYWLFGSGVMTALSGLTSLEVGIAAAISILGVIFLFDKNKFRSLGWWMAGGVTIGLPVILGMLIDGSLLPAIEQISYYSRVFSAGYFNLSIPGTPVSAYYQWSLFDEYFSSQLFGWELAKLGLLLGVFLGVKRLIEKKKFDLKDRLVVVLTIFGLIVFRGSLGRSDWYHLLFGLLIALIVLTVVLEKMIGVVKTSLVLGVLLIVFARVGLRTHLDNLFVDIQTHGQVLGNVQSYDFERMGIRVDEGVEIYKLNEIVTYLRKEIGKDEKVFMFPWMPDLYFFADVDNPTKNDIPYSFYTQKYQEETIDDLEKNPETIIVFNPLRSFAGFDAARLVLLNEYIQKNYEVVDEVGMFKILRSK